MPSENKQLVRRLFLELWNQRKLAVADEIFASRYVHHDPATPDFGKGPEEALQDLLQRIRFENCRVNVGYVKALGLSMPSQ